MKHLIAFAAAALVAGTVAAQEGAAQSANPQVVLETSKGAITVELFADKAPKTVENFLGYVESGFFTGTIFHRVMPNFMIQGGGFGEDLQKKTTRDPIQNEADNGLKNTRGTLAMARTRDPHSATAQFFINLVDNAFLNHTDKGGGWGYAVFGQVTDGMDVVDAIAAVRTVKNQVSEGFPTETILIKAASVKKTE